MKRPVYDATPTINAQTAILLYTPLQSKHNITFNSTEHCQFSILTLIDNMKNLKLKSFLKELSIYNSDNILNALSSSPKYIGTIQTLH